jgi:heme exporter protein A
MLPNLRPSFSTSRGASVPAVVEAQAIAVRLSGVPVLRALDLRVRPGEAVGLTGANGSGKSTLLRVLATLLRPSSGRLEILGQDVRAAPSVRSDVALVAHEPALHPDLTLAENLRLVAALSGRQQAQVDVVLAQVGLAAAAERPARACSEGMRRRAELARVLLCRPRLLLLDEAHAALDTEARRLIGHVVEQVRARDGAAVLVTHDPHALADVVDRVVLLRSGRLVATESA